MDDIFDDMKSRARDCEQLVADIDLIRPQTYEAGLSTEKVVEIIHGASVLYDLRFSALSEAYSEAVGSRGFFHYPIEECLMQWWGACEDMLCAAQGAKSGALDLDGIDNVLLGVRSMAIVRAARFHELLQAARPEPLVALADPDELAAKKAKKGMKAKKSGSSKRTKPAKG